MWPISRQQESVNFGESSSDRARFVHRKVVHTESSQQLGYVCRGGMAFPFQQGDRLLRYVLDVQIGLAMLGLALLDCLSYEMAHILCIPCISASFSTTNGHGKEHN